MSAWCFRELAEWKDVYKKLGYSDEASGKQPKQGILTLTDLKAFLAEQKRELEIKWTVPANSSCANTEIARLLTDSDTPRPESNTTSIVIDQIDKVVTDPDYKQPKEHSARDNYGFVPAEREKGFHFWYQKQAIVEIVDKVMEGKTGILLLAPGGYGKTFVMGSTVGRLVDAHYADGKTFSHIQYLWITRQTVVEQTRRVLEKYYSLDPYTDLEVINVDAVRSTVGKLWVKEDIKIVQGEEEVTYRWKPAVNPVVVIFDESQSAKNSTSKTHDIMCAYNNLPSNKCLISVSCYSLHKSF